MISSKNALNFAYAMYLHLRGEGQMTEGEIKRVVRKWFVMSLITTRYTGSFESAFDADIRRIAELGANEFLDNIEKSSMSDNFWDVAVPMAMESPSVRSPFFQTYLAAQVHSGARGFLSKNITVANMLEESGDIHHLVPKNYLQKNGVADRNDYNQIANFALTETPINIGIKDSAPADYMERLKIQIADGERRLGEITELYELKENLAANAVPDSIYTSTAESYGHFLTERRLLMSHFIRDYYRSL
jgi:hypothetical protein